MSPDAVRILAAISRHATAFDLTSDKLGESLCKVFTDGVQATIAAEQDPDGTPWADLSEAYAEEKARRFPGKPIGVRSNSWPTPTRWPATSLFLAPTPRL